MFMPALVAKISSPGALTKAVAGTGVVLPGPPPYPAR